ncbi:MAG TPA: ABC transporter substrate-binding protein [Xanthobacteraceae bacterium]|nr:ABC transporter substrate-binding protein [Xanthobacteraceae bacterium]
MKKLNLTVATDDYDHFRDFRLGLVKAEGIETTWLTMDIHEVFARFAANREWDVSELSFAKFVAQATEDNPDIVGLPVFASRMFRMSSFYINKKSGIKTAADLRGKKIGLPEWAQTAAVYTRGWLQHEAGVPLAEIDWYQAGTEQAGRTEKVELNLPKGLRLTRMPDKTLSAMIASGELDAVMIARPPSSFVKKHPDVVRLFPDFQAEEMRQFERTRVYPIMHIIALKRSVLKDHPWVARNLFNAFEESKDRSMQRLTDAAVSRYPVPWLADHIEKLQAKYGKDLYPYGIEENRPTLETFLQYAYEQGIARRHAKPEEIFPAGIMVSVKV